MSKNKANNKNKVKIEESVKQTFYSNKYFPVLISILFIVIGLASAISLSWISDDAFITLRYAKNFIEGKGLVYNMGEYIEGYTNFLWLMIIVGFNYIGFESVSFSTYFSLLFYISIIVLMVYLNWKSNKNVFVFPLTAAILVSHYDFRIWATSGLETMMFTFIVTLAIVLPLIIENQKKLFFSQGLLLSLAVLTRPDGALILFIVFGLTTIKLFWEVRKISNENITSKVSYFFKDFLFLIIPLILILIPYFIWKISYFGNLLPNTYYAKAGGMSYYSQGFFYLYTYFKSYFSSFLFLSFFIIVIKKISSKTIHLILEDRNQFVLLMSALTVVVYLIFFVAKVGGDFMYARFLIPMIPIIYFIAETSLSKLIKSSKVLNFIFVFVVLFNLGEKSFRDNLFINENGERISIYELNGIADEHWFYTNTESYNGINHISFSKLFSEELKKYFRNKEVKVLIYGAQACLAYYADFDYVIENNGLTDSTIAHQPLTERGRIGHERVPSYSYLSSKGIDFAFEAPSNELPDFHRIDFKILNQYFQATIVTYDKKLLNILENEFPNSIRYVNFESYLDEYLKNSNNLTKEQIKADYDYFEKFYFNHNQDSNRKNLFLNLLKS